MIISKFGSPLVTQTSVRGERGIGFNTTPDGDYDMREKRLRNVGEPETSNDAVNMAYFTKSMAALEDKTNVDIERIAKKLDDHINDVPFVVTPEGDLRLKYKTVMGQNGVEIQEKRKVKGIGYPSDPEDSTHRKFVVDSINRKFGDIPFTITKDGDLEFKNTEIKNPDGSKTIRKRKLLNIDDISLNKVADNNENIDPKNVVDSDENIDPKIEHTGKVFNEISNTNTVSSDVINEIVNKNRSLPNEHGASSEGTV